MMASKGSPFSSPVDLAEGELGHESDGFSLSEIQAISRVFGYRFWDSFLDI